MRFALTVLGVTAALISVTSCADDATSPQERAEARELTAAERELLAEAEEILIRDCMRDAGFKMFSADEPEPAADLPFGNDDVAYARRHGLGLGETNIGGYRERHPNMRYFKSLSSQQQEKYGSAMNGEPGKSDVSVQLPTGFEVRHSRDGCIAGAEDRLYGDFARWFDVRTRVENLPAMFMPKVIEDPKYRSAIKAWSACMRDKGQPAESPSALRDRFRRDAESKPEQTNPSEAELTAAAAEAACGKRTDLAQIGNDLEERFSRQEYEAHRALVLDYQRMSVAALPTAREIAGGSQS